MGESTILNHGLNEFYDSFKSAESEQLNYEHMFKRQVQISSERPNGDT